MGCHSAGRRQDMPAESLPQPRRRWDWNSGRWFLREDGPVCRSCLTPGKGPVLCHPGLDQGTGESSKGNRTQERQSRVWGKQGSIQVLFSGKLHGLGVESSTADGSPSLTVRVRCVANIWRFFALLPIVAYLHSWTILDGGGEMPYLFSHSGPERRKWPISSAVPQVKFLWVPGAWKRLSQVLYEHTQGTYFQAYLGAQVSAEFIFKQNASWGRWVPLNFFFLKKSHSGRHYRGLGLILGLNPCSTTYWLHILGKIIAAI